MTEENRMTMEVYKAMVAGKMPMTDQEAQKGAQIASQRESDMQTELERLLHIRGYWRRSTEWIRAGQLPPRGWQIHLHVTKRNPILLDIVLLGNDGRYTEFELKTATGGYSGTEQQVLCVSHKKPLFRSVADAYEHVIGWEACCG